MDTGENHKTCCVAVLQHTDLNNLHLPFGLKVQQKTKTKLELMASFVTAPRDPIRVQAGGQRGDHQGH